MDSDFYYPILITKVQKLDRDLVSATFTLPEPGTSPFQVLVVLQAPFPC